MSREVRLTMPKLSMTMEEGELVDWVKSVGDTVQEGDVVCEVMTDKVEMEVESPFTGTIVRILAEDGARVAVGAPIAILTTDSEDFLGDLLDAPTGDLPTASSDDPSGVAEPAGDPPAQPVPPATAEPPEPPEQAAPPEQPTPTGPVRAVPAARARAAALGVELASVRGSGPNGLITVADVQAAGQTDGGGDGGAMARRRHRTRLATARVMAASAAVPQFTLYADADLDALAARRGRLSWTTLVVRAAALALRDAPDLTASWRDGDVVPGRDVRVALAVDSPAGLVAPVLADPDRLAPAALDDAIRSVAGRARAGGLTAADVEGATFTVSNLGTLGVAAFGALITPPQAAVLSVGAVAAVPVAVDGLLGVRLRCRLGLTVDHRVADGADGARYLAAVTGLLAAPDRLLGAG